MELFTSPHKRYNSLVGEWVLVSAQRTARPWQGKVEQIDKSKALSYDPVCYLCPGNKRASGLINPNYQNTFVFQNDFSALLTDTKHASLNKADLLVAVSEKGLCLVVCYSPRHDLTIPLMEIEAIEKIVDVWQRETKRLKTDYEFKSILIFENRGEIMGCSNPHPHGQIWANQHIPNLLERENICQTDFWEKKKSCLLCSYLELENKEKERLVEQNDSFLVVVPFWAVWPFETLLLPKKHASSLLELTEKEKKDLAVILKRLQIRYDNLFSTTFPFSMGIHQEPFTVLQKPHWHWHIHFNPPLLRSANIQKFMVGYEMFAQPQRDLTAEKAAEKLREQSLIHWIDN